MGDEVVSLARLHQTRHDPRVSRTGLCTHGRRRRRPGAKAVEAVAARSFKLLPLLFDNCSGVHCNGHAGG